MKTYCKDYVFSKEKIYEAHKTWLKSDSGKENYWRIPVEYGSLDNLVDGLYYEITHRCLYFRPIVYHYEAEKGSGKLRLIGQQSVKQQICDYIAINALEPLLKAKLGYYQVGGVKGKGPLRGAQTIKKWLDDPKDLYYISGDYVHCYEETPTWCVVDILCKYVKNTTVYYICNSLLDTYNGGLEIGSVFSLKMSLLVLSFVYHRIEGLMKTRRGNNIPLVQHQIWYADNVYIFGYDKRNLKLAMKSIETYSMANFKLRMHDWKVSRADSQEPIDFAGHRVYYDHITIRDSTYLRIKRAYSDYEKNPTLKNARTVCSYWGRLKHTDSAKAIRENGYFDTFQKARSRVSRYDRMRAAHASNNRRSPSRQCDSRA